MNTNALVMVAPRQNMIELPTDSRRERKNDSGTSGMGLRVSTRTNRASSTGAAISEPITGAEVQPSAGAREKPKVKMVAAAVASSAPGRSSRGPRPARRGARGSTGPETANSAAPIGTFTNNTQRQSSSAV